MRGINRLLKRLCIVCRRISTSPVRLDIVLYGRTINSRTDRSDLFPNGIADIIPRYGADLNVVEAHCSGNPEIVRAGEDYSGARIGITQIDARIPAILRAVPPSSEPGTGGKDTTQDGDHQYTKTAIGHYFFPVRHMKCLQKIVILWLVPTPMHRFQPRWR